MTVKTSDTNQVFYASVAFTGLHFFCCKLCLSFSCLYRIAVTCKLHYCLSYMCILYYTRLTVLCFVYCYCQSHAGLAYCVVSTNGFHCLTHISIHLHRVQKKSNIFIFTIYFSQFLGKFYETYSEYP